MATDKDLYVTPFPYEGRLDVCPWCKKRPSVYSSPLNKWRVECMQEGCPMHPMSYSYGTVEEAVGKWNYLIKGKR